MRDAEFTPNTSETLRSVTYALSTKNLFQEKMYIYDVHELLIVYVLTAFARLIDKSTHCSPLVAPFSRSSSVSAEALEHSRSKILLATICLDSHLPRTRDPLFTVLLGVGNLRYEATEKMRNTIERDTTSHMMPYIRHDDDEC